MVKNLIISKTYDRVFLEVYFCTIFSGFAFILLLTNPVAAKTSITVATWNINNLHEDAGSAIRPGAPVRQEEDYAILISYRKKLYADIVALQEIGSPQAAARIFPPDEYTILFLLRYNKPVGKGGWRATSSLRSPSAIQSEF